MKLQYFLPACFILFDNSYWMACFRALLNRLESILITFAASIDKLLARFAFTIVVVLAECCPARSDTRG